MVHGGVENTAGDSGSGAYHGKYGFEAFTHNRPVVPAPGSSEYLINFRYPPHDMKNMSRVTVKNPSSERVETMEDQKMSTSTAVRASKLPETSAKWAAVAVILAMVDARMGGKPRLLEMLRSVVGGLRSRLPL